MPMQFPSAGSPSSMVIREIEQMQTTDVDWRDGRAFAYVYHAGADLEALVKRAYCAAFFTNGLSPTVFASLGRMEREVLQMLGDLFGCVSAVGSMTSGGSESIFLAVKAARDYARRVRPEIRSPQMLLPSSAHPAFSKAGHALDVEAIRIPVAPETLRADPARMAQAVGPDTVLLVGSAPSYPHGVVDPIARLGIVARDAGILLHVDACVGGMLLPFVKELGRPVPEFDFSVPGVSSISVDLHKFGYAAKGASAVLYRDQHVFAHQQFEFHDWPGGNYNAPNLAGTRPGGAIAAAWAALMFLGKPGYVELARRAMHATDVIVGGVRQIEGMHIIGEPDASLVAFDSEILSLASIVEGMRERGWVLGLQGPPSSIHLTITANHDQVAEKFMEDLRETCTSAARLSDAEEPGSYN